MKIAHISIIPAFSPGIFKKIEDKSKVARNVNIDMDFYLLNPVKEYADKNLFLIKTSYDYLPSSFLKSVFFRLFKLINLEKLIDLEKYDAIILRYPLIDSIGTRKFIEKYGYKIFTEHHSDEISELIAVGRIVDKVRVYIERFYAHSFLIRIRGIIGVTEEIRQVELQKIQYANKASTVISNGIDINSVSVTSFSEFDDENLKLVFVASEFSPWHGLEKLLDILDGYIGDIKITLTLVGIVSDIQWERIKKIVHSNIDIICVGRKYGKELDTILSNTNLAISSLALSRNKMKEACPLKAREYIARRLPFVYAYKDTDLDGNEIFAKHFEEDRISMEEIIKFAKNVTKNKITIDDTMKLFAESKIDWTIKVMAMNTFVCDEINKSKIL